MLTLVAAVLAYDLALETCESAREMNDARSSKVETDAEPRIGGLRSLAASLNDKSCTRLEKDILEYEVK